MKVTWILRASMKDINPKQYYSDYDARCLSSNYWLYDIICFVKDNNGTIQTKKQNYINEYEIVFDIQKYNFNIRDFIKFSSGRFYTYNLTCLLGSWNQKSLL